MGETDQDEGGEYDPSWITGKDLVRHFALEDALLEFSRLFKGKETRTQLGKETRTGERNKDAASFRPPPATRNGGTTTQLVCLVGI